MGKEREGRGVGRGREGERKGAEKRMRKGLGRSERNIR